MVPVPHFGLTPFWLTINLYAFLLYILIVEPDRAADAACYHFLYKFYTTFASQL